MPCSALHSTLGQRTGLWGLGGSARWVIALCYRFPPQNSVGYAIRALLTPVADVMELPLLEHSCKQADRTESVAMKWCPCGRVLGAGGYRVGLCEKKQGLHLCQTQLVPARSKMNPPQGPTVGSSRGPTLEQSVPEGLYTVIRTHAAPVLQGLESNLRAAAVISSGGKVSTTPNRRLLKEQFGLKRIFFPDLYCRKSSLASVFTL